MKNLLSKTLLLSFVCLNFLFLPAVAGQTQKAKASLGPRTDAEVQTCINDKFKGSTSIKSGTAQVKDGVATLTGDAASGGAKGGATRSARACGAKTVENHLVTPARVKSKAKTTAMTR